MADIFQSTMMMGVALLHKCNFNCAHCGYLYVGESDDHIVKPGYRVTWDQMQKCIADCNSIEDASWSMLFTGGEPTLWKEGKLTFIDLLLAVEKAGIYPSFNTNGSYFDDLEKCRTFFTRYLEKAKLTLQIFISIDNFHNNYDREKGRSLCLDNVVKILDEIPADKKELFKIHVITIVTKDPDSTLPQEMKDYYSPHGITFGDFPMMPIGRAKELVDLLPDAPKFTPPPPPPETDKKRNYGAVLMGDAYYRNNVKVGELGRLAHMYD